MVTFPLTDKITFVSHHYAQKVARNINLSKQNVVPLCFFSFLSAQLLTKPIFCLTVFYLKENTNLWNTLMLLPLFRVLNHPTMQPMKIADAICFLFTKFYNENLVRRLSNL